MTNFKYRISADKVIKIYEALSDEETVGADGGEFCRTSAAVVQRWLADAAAAAPFDDMLCYAAACMANYRRVLKSSVTASDLKAGDISIIDCSQKAVAYAKALYDDALSDVEFLLKPKRFAFVSVKG